MNNLLDLFLAYIVVEKGLSKNTLEAYSHDICGYLTFLEASGCAEPKQVKPTDVAAWEEEGLDHE